MGDPTEASVPRAHRSAREMCEKPMADARAADSERARGYMLDRPIDLCNDEKLYRTLFSGRFVVSLLFFDRRSGIEKNLKSNPKA